MNLSIRGIIERDLLDTIKSRLVTASRWIRQRLTTWANELSHEEGGTDASQYQNYLRANH